MTLHSFLDQIKEETPIHEEGTVALEDGLERNALLDGLADDARLWSAPAWATAPEAGWPTTEHALHGLILLAATATRFLALTLEPLTALEAGNAWAAWLAAWGLSAPVVPAPSSPLLYTLQSFLFWVVGGSDALARAIPAVAGTILVWLPWLLRRQIGHNRALILSALLALDPWLVAFSRLSDGVILTMLFGFLTLIGLMHILEKSADEAAGTRAWVTITSISTGLLLVSGSQAWSFVAVLLYFVWTHGHWRLALTRAEAHRGLIYLSGSALLGATGWLSQPEGLGYISTSLSHWLAQFVRPDDGGYPLLWLGLRLLVDAPLLLVFGMGGLTVLWRQAMQNERRSVTRWPAFLTAWTLWGTLLLVLPGRTPLALPMLGLPLLIAVTYGLDAVIRQVDLRAGWREGLVLVATLAILLVSGLFWVTALVHSNQLNLDMLQATGVIVLLIILMIVFFGVWSGWAQAGRLIGGCSAVLLVLAMMGASWELNHQSGVMYPDALFAQKSASDVRRLAQDIATLSAQRVGDAHQIEVQVEMKAAPDPVLGWYLRELHNLTWTPSPAVAGNNTATVLVEYADDAFGSQKAENYLGSAYGLYREWLPTRLVHVEIPTLAEETGDSGLARLQRRWSLQTQPLLRWIFYREIKQLPQSTSVVLWVPPVE